MASLQKVTQISLLRMFPFRWHTERWDFEQPSSGFASRPFLIMLLFLVLKTGAANHALFFVQMNSRRKQIKNVRLSDDFHHDRSVSRRVSLSLHKTWSESSCPRYSVMVVIITLLNGRNHARFFAKPRSNSRCHSFPVMKHCVCVHISCSSSIGWTAVEVKMIRAATVQGPYSNQIKWNEINLYYSEIYVSTRMKHFLPHIGS